MNKKTLPRRYVAFVDILGFESLIERMIRSDSDDLYETIRDSLNSIAEQAKVFQNDRHALNKKFDRLMRGGKVPLMQKSTFRMTAFSDCYLLSDRNYLWRVLAAVQAIASRFLTKGVLTRGGIVRGRAYHLNNVVFGPAVIKAYKIEKQLAHYPRILVDPSVIEEAQGYNTGPVWSDTLLERDADSLWHLNLMTPSRSRWQPLIGKQEVLDISGHLRLVRNGLKQALAAADGKPEYMSKVGWIVSQFNIAAKRARLDGIKLA